LGEDGPDMWDRADMRSLTGGPADVRGPFGSNDREGSRRRLASRHTGSDGAAVLGRRRGKRLMMIFKF
jgi:hypothetical protein